MEAKKNPKSDLEKLRTIFLQIGFVLTLGVLLIAFEWKSSTSGVEILELTAMADEEEMIQQTRQENQPPPPPPPPQQQQQDIIQIVEDDEEIEDELEVEDAESDETDEVEVEIVEDEEEPETDEIFYIVEKQPHFKDGGELGLRKFITKSVRYPNIARENNIQGKVYVRFVVTKKGKVDKVQILRGVDPLLDKEALRVVKSLPDWDPGEQRNKKVSVWYTLPINFQLQ